MRLPAFMYPNPVTVHAVSTDNTNLSGDDVRDIGVGTPYMASVQQGSASLAASLIAEAAIQAGAAVFTVFFASEPIDTSGGNMTQRPIGTIHTRDVIVWMPPTGPARTLMLLGPVRVEGGGTVAWSCDCVEVA